jgi:nucleoside-diphosphate-sugar epimerase
MTKWSQEKVLVTGAAGFVGANLARRLSAEGAEVHAIVRESRDLWRLKGIKGRVSIHAVDLLDEEALQKLCREISPTVIYHLATHGAYSSQTDASKILLTNIIGTWNLLKALERVNYKLFLNTGSSSEYGFKQAMMREDDRLEPNSYYAVSKASAGLLCQYISRACKKPVVTFRLFSAYGPYEEPSRLIPTIIRRCVQAQALQMASPDTVRDFVYVGDIVDACLDLDHLQHCAGEIINIASGRQCSLKEITDIVIELTGSKVDVLWNAMPDRIWDSSVWVGDAMLAQELLGWRAKTTLREGLIQTIEWNKKNGPIKSNSVSGLSQ